MKPEAYIDARHFGLTFFRLVSDVTIFPLNNSILRSSIILIFVNMNDFICYMISQCGIYMPGAALSFPNQKHSVYISISCASNMMIRFYIYILTSRKKRLI